MPERPFSSDYDAASQRLVVHGVVDEDSKTQFRDALVAATDQFGHSIVVDLSDVDFFPSLGVAALAVTQQKADEQGVLIDVVAAEGTIAKRILDICGIANRPA